MMSSGGWSANEGAREPAAVPVERSEPEPRATGDLMERVLQETLSATARGQPLDAAEMAALLDVARRHAGAALSLEPVAVDLVQALLQVRFASLVTEAEFRLAAATRIATTLWDDPPSHDRLEVFWNRLSEAVR